MIQFLQQLDDVGARAEGLSKLLPAGGSCECTESLDVKQIRDDLKAGSIRFENLSLICEIA